MSETVLIAGAALAATAMLCATFLRAWRGWLEVRRLEIGRDAVPPPGEAGIRIELADVRERLRKIEAIADGIEP